MAKLSAETLAALADGTADSAVPGGNLQITGVTPISPELANNLRVSVPLGDLNAQPLAGGPLNLSDQSTILDPVAINHSGANQAIKFSPEPNPLLDYASYTYHLSLHALSKDDYNKISETGEYQPKNILISGAGKYTTGPGFERNANFKHDFYFDKLSMNTIVGCSARTRMTNAIEVNFTIIEPNGVTLLNRIILTSEKVNAANYLQMPYLIQIDFYGYDDLGNIVASPIPNMTKFIPVKLIAFKVKISAKGAEYAIQAIPFNHDAYTETNVTCPINLSVIATTIGDFFADVDVDVTTKSTAHAKEYDNRLKAVAANNKLTDAQKEAASQQIIRDSKHVSYGTSSYTGAVNNWLTSLKYDRTDKIIVKVDPLIAKEKIVITEKTDPKWVIMADNKEKASSNANAGGNAGEKKGGADFLTNVFAVNAGTSVIAVIENAIKNSDYIRSQLTSDEDRAARAAVAAGNGEAVAKEKGEAFKWYKVTPQILLGDYDAKRGEFSKIITYHVTPFSYHNDKSPLIPKSTPPGVCKVYNYLYTGQNNDVIDFNIDFDCMYYTALTFNPAKVESTNNAIAANAVNQSTAVIPKSEDKVSTPVTRQNSGNTHTTSSGGAADAKTVEVGDVLKSVLSDSRGDMINIQVRINGDPHFIKQDDLFYSPAQAEYKLSPNGFTKNGSLATDVAEIYALVTFNTPTDFSDSTGLMIKDDKYTASVFSGVFRILTVDNVFQNGKFEQTLDMIRLFDQPMIDTKSLGLDVVNKQDKENRPQTKGDYSVAKTPVTMLLPSAGGKNPVEAVEVLDTQGPTPEEAKRSIAEQEAAEAEANKPPAMPPKVTSNQEWCDKVSSLQAVLNKHIMTYSDMIAEANQVLSAASQSGDTAEVQASQQVIADYQSKQSAMVTNITGLIAEAEAKCKG